jgi:hypothetical protein
MYTYGLTANLASSTSLQKAWTSIVGQIVLVTVVIFVLLVSAAFVNSEDLKLRKKLLIVRSCIPCQGENHFRRRYLPLRDDVDSMYVVSFGVLCTNYSTITPFCSSLAHVERTPMGFRILEVIITFPLLKAIAYTYFSVMSVIITRKMG